MVEEREKWCRPRSRRRWFQHAELQRALRLVRRIPRERCETCGDLAALEPDAVERAVHQERLERGDRVDGGDPRLDALAESLADEVELLLCVVPGRGRVCGGRTGVSTSAGAVQDRNGGHGRRGGANDMERALQVGRLPAAW